MKLTEPQKAMIKRARYNIIGDNMFIEPENGNEERTIKALRAKGLVDGAMISYKAFLTAKGEKILGKLKKEAARPSARPV
jgi:hypothetical protein